MLKIISVSSSIPATGAESECPHNTHLTKSEPRLNSYLPKEQVTGRGYLPSLGSNLYERATLPPYELSHVLETPSRGSGFLRDLLTCLIWLKKIKDAQESYGNLLTGVLSFFVSLASFVSLVLKFMRLEEETPVSG